VRALARRQPLDDVAGIRFKREGRPVRTRPAPPPELDDLPPMPYELVPVEQYIGNQTNYPARIQRALPVDGSRGCPFRCAYCSEPMTSLRKYRMKQAARMYEEMEYLVQTYRLQAITIFDDEFLINRKWSEEVAELIGGKFQWWCQARMASLLRYDLARLERNGMCAVQPGIESGSNRVLKFIKKDEDVAEFVEANRALARTGITPLYNFMMGFPTETREEVLESVDLALRLIDENPRAEIAGFNIFTPYPGTELYRIGIEHGFRPPTDLRGWAKFHRQQRATPWIQDDLSFYLDLMLTSKLLDGRRVKRVVDAMYPWLPFSGAALDLIGRYMRRKYRRHRFGDQWSSTAIRVVLDKWLNW
jgi:anaerobic magnesium-protoporphyrin IX monomethyl ester cyclase